MYTPLRILDEHRIDLDEVCRLLGTTEKPASRATGLRAMNHGGRKPDGGRAYLEHLHLAGQVISSREAVERYLAEINGINLGGAEPVTATPPRARKREAEIARAARECEALGM
jgi:hypothetical protein